METYIEDENVEIISSQPGPQTQLLECEADICFFGGQAGGGKTYGLLLDASRHEDNPECGCIIFRRTSPQITAEGSIWDVAKDLFIPMGARPRESPQMSLTFSDPQDVGKPGYKITFSHLQHEKNKYDYQGSQIPVLMFEEVTQFTRSQYDYLVGRNRTTCGIKPYVRASCNPDKSSWVRLYIDWWIGKDGLAIMERAGTLRWICVFDGQDNWFDTKEEAQKAFPEIPPLSVTFIPAKLTDNKILMEKDPGYLAKLMALPKVERERLLGGNWNIQSSAGMYFKRYHFEEVPNIPPLKKIVRCWDRAATEWKHGDSKDPDYTVGFKLGQLYDDSFIILDIVRDRMSPGNVEKMILNTARQDGRSVSVKGFQDPGSAGVAEIENFVKLLRGFHVVTERIATDKETAAKPVSSHSEKGFVKILASCSNKENFYSETENFPEDGHDDIVDGFSGAFNYLNLQNVGEFTKKHIPNTIKKNLKKRDVW